MNIVHITNGRALGYRVKSENSAVKRINFDKQNGENEKQGMGNPGAWAMERAMDVVKSTRDLAATPTVRNKEETSRLVHDRAVKYDSPDIKISNVGNSGGMYYQSQRNYSKSEHGVILIMI